MAAIAETRDDEPAETGDGSSARSSIVAVHENGTGAGADASAAVPGATPEDVGTPYSKLAGSKIVMAPVNIAGQPITLVNELRRNGANVSLVQYVGNADGHKFGYERDRIVRYSGSDRSKVQIRMIEELLSEGTDLFHFWLRTLFFGGVHTKLTGFDLPFLKAYGRKIVYRFTGEDLRARSLHERVNPYSAYRYGYSTIIDEARQGKYLDFIAEFVDQFVVQDPELHEYWPTARIVPRALDLTQWHYCGPVSRDRPLVVHAPSNPMVKGTPFVRAAVEALKDDGLDFDYREIADMPHDDAAAIYRAADIVVDQLHIGWYGVLAIEALALGKTVITYVREPLGERLGVPIPILNANPDTIKDVLRGAIKDYDLRCELAPRARHFVETVHDATIVAQNLAGLYGDVLAGAQGPRRVVERPYAGLGYLLDQHDVAEDVVVRLRNELAQVKRPAGNSAGRAAARSHRVRPVRQFGRWCGAIWRAIAGQPGGELADLRREVARLRKEAGGTDGVAPGVLRRAQSEIDRLGKIARRNELLQVEASESRVLKKRLLSEGERQELVEARRELKQLRSVAAKYETLKHEVFRLRYRVKKLSETGLAGKNEG
jgi:hypothetical protein